MTRTNSAYIAHASLPLMIWLSPAFPVGSFAYSHAIEWAVEAGDLPNAGALQSWLTDLLQHGAPRNDAIILAAAWRAAGDADMGALAEANNLALALAGSRERYLETTAQGDAFMIAIRAAWATDRLLALDCSLGVPPRHDLMPALVPGNESRDPTAGGLATVASGNHRSAIASPVAIGLAAAAHDVELGATLDAYLTALVTNFTSAAIRLGITGQTDAQRIVMEAVPAIRELGQFAAHATLDDVGGCAFRSDIGSMRHETQATRLFRT